MVRYAAVNFELRQRELVQSEDCSPMFSIIFWEFGEIFHFFPVVFHASTGEKLQGKNTENFTGPGNLMLNIQLL